MILARKTGNHPFSALFSILGGRPDGTVQNVPKRVVDPWFRYLTKAQTVP
jgi:hypothetical protein